MVRLENISKSFENIKAVDNISFEIPESKITIIAGADGSGKSTIFKMIVALLKRIQEKFICEKKILGKITGKLHLLQDICQSDFLYIKT